MATVTMLMLAATTAEAFMVVGGGSASILRRGGQAFVAPALRGPSFTSTGRVRRFTAENAALATSMAAKKVAVRATCIYIDRFIHRDFEEYCG